MDVEYVSPLSRAWAHMKTMLFRPFDLGKWLVVAFTAWLAGLAGGGGGGGGGPQWRAGAGGASDVGEALRHAWDWVRDHVLTVPLVLTAVLVGIGLVLLVLWLSSRGKMVFLDNVVRDRGEVVEPWQRLGHLGDSLFAWRLAFFGVVLAAFVALGVVAFVAFGDFGDFHEAGWPQLAGAAALALAAAGLGIVTAYVALFLDSFVVPIMVHENLPATAAWRRFLPVLDTHVFAFVLYGLFVLALFLGVAAAIVAAGLFTCCVGFVLLAVPYVGTVILLPLLVTYRAFSIEFLAQFGVIPPLSAQASRQPRPPEEP